MNRRDWLKAAGVTGASFVLPSAMISAQAASGAAQLDTEIKRLKLRHTWTTTMSSSNSGTRSTFATPKTALSAMEKALRSSAITRMQSMIRGQKSICQTNEGRYGFVQK